MRDTEREREREKETAPTACNIQRKESSPSSELTNSRTPSRARYLCLSLSASLSLSLPRQSREVSKDSEGVRLEAGRSPRRTRRSFIHESARDRAGRGGEGTRDVVESEEADDYRPGRELGREGGVRGLAARRAKPESSM